MNKRSLIAGILYILLPLTSFAECYEGTFKVPFATDKDGVHRSGEFTFKAEMPTKDSEGRFISVLVNSEEQVNFEIKGKTITKIGQIFTPDDLVLVKPGYTVRCPCELAESADQQVVMSVEMRGDRSLEAKFLKYFSRHNISIESISQCQE